MDTLTHIALGACMGEAMAGKRVGRKAILAGVLAQSLPDIDFVAAIWLQTADNLLAHRGFTHSFFFILLVTPLLALLASYIFRNKDHSFRHWLLFFLVISLSHVLLDSLNNYGTGWFEPFSSKRISFNVLYVADPFFSVLPGIASFFLLFRHRYQVRKWLWVSGLAGSLLYTGYCVVNKIRIEQRVQNILSRENIAYKRYLTTPAPLQNWLWFVAAETEKGFYTGYVSVFDRREAAPLHFSPRNDTLLKGVEDPSEAAKLIVFSQGYYTLEKERDTLIINDLRFGQIAGWDNPAERFAFHYYLQPIQDNHLVVQRGRFSKWNKKTFRSFIRRIKGN